MYYKDRIYEWIYGLIANDTWREGEEFAFGNLYGYAAIFGCSPDTVRGVLLNTKGFSILSDNGIVVEPTNNKERDFVCQLVKSPITTAKLKAQIDAEIDELRIKISDLEYRRTLI